MEAFVDYFKEKVIEKCAEGAVDGIPKLLPSLSEAGQIDDGLQNEYNSAKELVETARNTVVNDSNIVQCANELQAAIDSVESTSTTGNIFNRTWNTMNGAMKQVREEMISKRKVLECALKSPEIVKRTRIAESTLYTSRIKPSAQCFVPNTRGWIITKYCSWANNCVGNPILVLTGHGGIGKSTLAAKVIQCNWFPDTLRAETDVEEKDFPEVVAAFFFDYAESSTSQAMDCIRSIHEQLSNNLQGFSDRLQNQNNEDWTLEQVTNKLIVEPLLALQSSYEDVNNRPRSVIVIDGLDECANGVVLFQLLRDIWFKKGIKLVGIFATCRPEIVEFYVDDAAADKDGVTMLKTNDERNENDVRTILNAWLKDVVPNDQLARFVEIMVDKSESLFIYLRFFQRELEEWKDNHKNDRMLSEEDIKSFPDGLSGMYNTYFLRIYEALNNDDAKYQTMLGSVLASREPLPLEIWMRICGIQDVQNPSFDNLNQFVKEKKHLDALMHIPPTIKHDYVAGITFIHKTMYDYLTKPGRYIGTDGELIHDTSVAQGQRDEKYQKLHVDIANDSEGNPVEKLLQCIEPLFENASNSSVAAKYAKRNLFYLRCKRKSAESLNQAEDMIFDLNSLMFWLTASTALEVRSDISDHLIPKNSNVQQDTDAIISFLRLAHQTLHVQNLPKAVSGKQIPSQLPSQLLGRFHKDDVQNRPRLKRLYDAAETYDPGVPWLKPINATLNNALSPLLHELKGHEGEIKAVVFIHKGTQVVSCGGKSIRIWDTETGKLIHVLKADYVMLSMALSHNRNKIVFGTFTDRVQIWYPESGSIRVFKGHTGWVKSVAFNHDGTQVVSGSADKTVRIWNTETGESIHVLRGHKRYVESVAFSHNGTKIVSRSDDHNIPIWDTKTGKSIHVLKGHTNSVKSVEFNHDGTQVVSGSWDKTVRIWDTTTGETIHILKGHSSSVTSVVLSHDGTKIASSSSDKTVRVWDTETGESIQELKGHTQGVESVAFNHDGTQVVSGSQDKTVRIWNTETGESIQVLRGHTGSVTSVEFNHDGTQVVSGSYGMTVRIWNTNTGNSQYESKGHTGKVKSVAFNHNGTQLVSGSEDRNIGIWDTNTGSLIRELKGHTHYVTSVAFNHDGTRVVSSSVDMTVRIWDTNTGRLIREFKGHSRSVTSVTFNHDGTQVVSGSDDKTVRIWDTISGELIKELSGHTKDIVSVACNHNGTRVVSGSDDKTIRMWDTKTWKRSHIFKEHTDTVLSVAFNHDGTKIVSGSRDKTIRIWDADAKTRKSIHVLQGHTAPVVTVGFNQDGTQIISRSVNNIIRIWDAETGKLVDTPLLSFKSSAGVLPIQANSSPVTVSPHIIGFTLDRSSDANSCMFRKDNHPTRICIVENHNVHFLVPFPDSS